MSIPSWIKPGSVAIIEALAGEGPASHNIMDPDTLPLEKASEWRVIRVDPASIFVIREEPKILERYERDPDGIYKFMLMKSTYGKTWSAFEVLGCDPIRISLDDEDNYIVGYPWP